MVGEQISHYRLESKIGSGTYGVVYRGVHVGDEELRVAIKVIQPSLIDDPRFVESLKTECRRLDKLDHPAIVRFRDLILGDDQVAMVLELLEGKDLHDHIHGGPIPLDEAMTIIEKALSGLAYAHSKDVIHRDIKPSNIFLCDDGRVKILDFGIARAAQSTQATQTGTMKGTLDYMAPERFQATGGGSVSDVYAMGLVAWELVAGKTACPDGGLPEKLGWHLGVGAPGLQTVRTDCPDWLADVVSQMTELDPAARYADGAAAHQAFQAARSGKATAPAPAATKAAPLAPSTVAVPKEEVEAVLAQVRQQSAAAAQPAPPAETPAPAAAAPPAAQPAPPAATPARAPAPVQVPPAVAVSAPPSAAAAPASRSLLPVVLGLVAVAGLVLVVVLVGAVMMLGDDASEGSKAAAQVKTTSITKSKSSPARSATPAPKPSSPWTLTGGRPADPSFKCSKARSWASTHICKDTQLADLDKNMARKFFRVKNRLQGYAKDNWVVEQKAWKNQDRDVCEYGPADKERKACMVRSYQNRISQIERHPSY